MTEPGLGILRWAFDAAAAVLVAVFGLMLRRMSKQDDRVEKLGQSLAAHKLHAAETFAPREELRQMEARLRDHMDGRFDDLKERLSELGR